MKYVLYIPHNLNIFLFFILQIFPVDTTTPSGNAIPLQLNERHPKGDFGQAKRLKRQASVEEQQTEGITDESLSPLMVRNFPPLAEEKQNCM